MNHFPVEKLGVVLRCGAPDAWDGGMTESPTVWYDDRTNRYAMVYTGYRWNEPNSRGYESVRQPQIGLAWSDDLVHWTKDPRNPIFGIDQHSEAYDKCGTAGPLVVSHGNMYFLFYFGTTEDGYERGTKALNVATSNNLTDWRRHQGNPVVVPHGSAWRSDAIWHPNVVTVGLEHFLFFNASGTVDGKEEERIGVARSSDLLNWVVDDDHAPILSGSGNPGSWDSSGRAGDPSVFLFRGRWIMAYYSWDGVNSQDGLAWTSVEEFPFGWTPLDCNPVLRLGDIASYDGLHAAKPFIVEREDLFFHFYTAVDVNETREIAVARWTADALSAALQ